MKDASKDTSFPQLTYSSWREAYEIDNLVRYEAPNKEAVSFIYDNVKISGGHYVDSKEYPSYCGWTNIAITENINKITVSGFLRGEEYISIRASLVEAFKVKTQDNNPAFIFIPLWGRLRVVLNGWAIEEYASENGQCKIELNCVLSLKEEEVLSSISLEEACDNLKTLASSSEIDLSFGESFVKMSEIIGKIQGKTEYINKMSRAINSAYSITASGIRTPAVYAQAVNNLFSSIVNGLIENKQAAIETVEDFTLLFSHLDSSENNIKKTLLQFLSFNFDNDFIKIIAVCSSAVLITEIDSTKDKLKNYLSLFDKLCDKLCDSISKNNYRNNYRINLALIDLKIALIEELKNKDLKSERKIKFNKNNNLLNVEHYLKCYNLRELNFIEDSFALNKEIIYE